MDKKRVLLVVFIVLVPFLLVLLSYKANISLSNYNPEQKEVVDFLHHKDSITADMTSAEFSHLTDVKDMVRLTDFILYSLVSVCALILVYNYKDGFEVKKPLFYGGICSLAIIVPLFLFTLLNFDLVFNLFHKVLFPQGNWIFSQGSFLIETFPSEFFISMAKKIILTAASFAVFLTVVGLSGIGSPDTKKSTKKK